MRHNRRYQRRASSDRTPIAREDSRNFNQYYRRGDIGKGGKRDQLTAYENHSNQSVPPPSPPPPTPPSVDPAGVGPPLAPPPPPPAKYLVELTGPGSP